MDDQYLTIASESEKETKIKASRFIGRTFLVESVKQAENILEQFRKKEYQANHNCFAYLIGYDKKQQVFKFSDDGEPSGTAGKPIYDVLAGSGLCNCLIIVTRYFGGTKLGTGGLVRAYSESAQLCLKASGVKENFITDQFEVTIDFSLYDRLLRILNKLKVKVENSEFTENVKLALTVRKSLSNNLEEEITELSHGQAEIKKL